MIVLGRRAEDIDEFMEKLEATGAFQDDRSPTQEDTTDEGLHRADAGAPIRTCRSATAAGAAKPAPAKPRTQSRQRRLPTGGAGSGHAASAGPAPQPAAASRAVAGREGAGR